jgi:hypothetical protein
LKFRPERAERDDRALLEAVATLAKAVAAPTPAANVVVPAVFAAKANEPAELELSVELNETSAPPELAKVALPKSRTASL